MALSARKLVSDIGPALRRWQTWGIIAVAAFLGMLAYYFVSGMSSPELPPTTAQQLLLMKGITGQAQKGQDLTWRFSAKATNTSPDGMVTTYYQATATYYLHGKPAYRLTAPQVHVDLRSQNYSASNGVHVWSVTKPKEEDFKTNYVQWSQTSQALNCPESVRLTYNGSTMVTSHLSVNLRSGETQFGQTSITSNS
jgi:hypothetical protein